MNGEHNERQPHPIQWDGPRDGGAEPAWRGPHPHDLAIDGPARGQGAPAPQSSPLDKWTQQPEGWNDAVPLAHADQAPASSAPLGSPWNSPQPNEYRPQRAGAASEPGWAGAVAPGATADEISHSYPDNSGFGWSGGSGASRFEAPDRDDHAPRRASSYRSDGVYDAGSADEGTSRPAQREDVPVSYASAPNVGQTGADSYASAPPQQHAPETPRVVDQHDDLPEDSLTIGRSRSNSIVLDDMLVSRRHVVITADEEGLLLRDLGSRNGTFVNGRRVEQTHLHEGDRIGIGASTFEVRDGWLVSV